MGYLRQLERNYEIAREMESEIDADADKLIKAAQKEPTKRIYRQLKQLIEKKESGITKASLSLAMEYVRENMK